MKYTDYLYKKAKETNIWNIWNDYIITIRSGNKINKNRF